MEKDKDKNIILYMLKVNDKLGPASAHLDTIVVLVVLVVLVALHIT